MALEAVKWRRTFSPPVATTASSRHQRGHERWSANLFIDNLTDKFAETGVRLDPSYIRVVNGFDVRRYFRNVIRPRAIGIEFRYRM